jgi:phage protein D
MIVPVRIARPSIVLGGKDYFSSLAPYFLNMEYTDNFDGKKGDDFHLQLADRDRRFINDWMPSKGVYVDVSIICERWFGPIAASLSLDCGRFWIDEISFDLPQHTVSVKATSIPTDGHIKTMSETRGWEKSDLQTIAKQIAGENNMSVDWQSDLNPKYDRVEQTEENGLRFLMKRASEQGISLKCHRGKLVFIEEKKLEAAAPAFTVVYGNAQAGSGSYRMTGGNFTTKIADVLKSAKLKHAQVETGETTQSTFTDPKTGLVSDQPGSGAAVVPESAYTDSAQAGDNVHDSTEGDEEGGGEEGNGGGNGGGKAGESGLVSGFESDSTAGSNKVKAHVRNANKDKDNAKVEMSIGNPLIAAGQTFMLQGVGQFDGKWFIESAKHHVGDAYKTELSIRRCLDY